ncbi:hypothetical protein MUK42_09866 [Musa troglodytarum]|uniref:GATA-type domain-containing protein n=1 Tax=Musa troglodytarum TaxID=320322 RepID=A0A9E7E9V6_9LILI|nr:hypothetical protein MUK42_09866 [Musa troglodytarum]
MDASSSDSQPKCCADCRTTKTPLWRAGPSGPKSLCNACGIWYRKNGRAFPVSKKKVEIGSGGELRKLGLGLREQRSMIQEQRRMRRKSMLGEEEAAVVLMALSSGFLYA